MLAPGQTLTLMSEDDTVALARQFASTARAGDCILLAGEIGAGKSTFARAFIRARLQNPSEDVPSPTFTLVQTYEHADGDIWHCDLYRLAAPDEVLELGLDEAFTEAICLIEWPDRLGDLAPSHATTLHLTASSEGHIVRRTDGLRT